MSSNDNRFKNKVSSLTARFGKDTKSKNSEQSEGSSPKKLFMLSKTSRSDTVGIEKFVIGTSERTAEQPPERPPAVERPQPSNEPSAAPHNGEWMQRHGEELPFQEIARLSTSSLIHTPEVVHSNDGSGGQPSWKVTSQLGFGSPSGTPREDHSWDVSVRGHKGRPLPTTLADPQPQMTPSYNPGPPASQDKQPKFVPAALSENSGLQMSEPAVMELVTETQSPPAQEDINFQQNINHSNHSIANREPRQIVTHMNSEAQGKVWAETLEPELKHALQMSVSPRPARRPLHKTQNLGSSSNSHPFENVETTQTPSDGQHRLDYLNREYRQKFTNPVFQVKQTRWPEHSEAPKYPQMQSPTQKQIPVSLDYCPPGVGVTLPTGENEQMRIMSYMDIPEPAYYHSQQSTTPWRSNETEMFGVGLVLNMVEALWKISGVVQGGSAARDGTVMEGDILVAIDSSGTSRLDVPWLLITCDTPFQDIARAVLGPQGTSIMMVLNRENDGVHTVYAVNLQRGPIEEEYAVDLQYGPIEEKMREIKMGKKKEGNKRPGQIKIKMSKEEGNEERGCFNWMSRKKELKQKEIQRCVSRTQRSVPQQKLQHEPQPGSPPGIKDTQTFKTLPNLDASSIIQKQFEEEAATQHAWLSMHDSRGWMDPVFFGGSREAVWDSQIIKTASPPHTTSFPGKHNATPQNRIPLSAPVVARQRSPYSPLKQHNMLPTPQPDGLVEMSKFSPLHGDFRPPIPDPAHPRPLSPATAIAQEQVKQLATKVVEIQAAMKGATASMQGLLWPAPAENQRGGDYNGIQCFLGPVHTTVSSRGMNSDHERVKAVEGEGWANGDRNFIRLFDPSTFTDDGKHPGQNLSSNAMQRCLPPPPKGTDVVGRHPNSFGLVEDYGSMPGHAQVPYYSVENLKITPGKPESGFCGSERRSVSWEPSASLPFPPGTNLASLVLFRHTHTNAPTHTNTHPKESLKESTGGMSYSYEMSPRHAQSSGGGKPRKSSLTRMMSERPFDNLSYQACLKETNWRLV